MSEGGAPEVGKVKKTASLLWACGCIGIVVLGISFDDPAANRAFAEKFGFPFVIISGQQYRQEDGGNRD